MPNDTKKPAERPVQGNSSENPKPVPAKPPVKA